MPSRPTAAAVWRWSVLGAIAGVAAISLFSEFRAVYWSEPYDRPWPSQVIICRSTLSVWIHDLRPEAEGPVVPTTSPTYPGGFLLGSVSDARPHRDWWPEFAHSQSDTAVHWRAVIPAWCILLPLAVPAASMLWRGPVLRAWRRRHGRCPACGYDLAGTAKCPECGTTQPAPLGPVHPPVSHT